MTYLENLEMTNKNCVSNVYSVWSDTSVFCSFNFEIEAYYF